MGIERESERDREIEREVSVKGRSGKCRNCESKGLTVIVGIVLIKSMWPHSIETLNPQTFCDVKLRFVLVFDKLEHNALVVMPRNVKVWCYMRRFTFNIIEDIVAMLRQT